VKKDEEVAIKHWSNLLYIFSCSVEDAARRNQQIAYQARFRMQLHLDLPIDGPKTLNGLLLEILQDIPEASVSLKITGIVIEIVQVQEHTIRMVKLYRP
jgi:Mg2+/Co2+ transporter CorB